MIPYKQALHAPVFYHLCLEIGTALWYNIYVFHIFGSGVTFDTFFPSLCMKQKAEVQYGGQRNNRALLEEG